MVEKGRNMEGQCAGSHYCKPLRSTKQIEGLASTSRFQGFLCISFVSYEPHC